MKFLNRLERHAGRFAVPRITVYIIFLQSLTFVLLFAAEARDPERAVDFLSRIELVGSQVLHGQVWRVLTFMVVPPPMNPLFFFFAMYFLYLMGTALENHWGTFRYNLYLLVGWMATVAVSLAMPAGPATNGYLMESILLAFAFLYPDFQIYIFLVLPVKVKWIALVTWIILLIQFIGGNWFNKCLVLAAVANFVLFFHSELWQRAKGGHRRMLSKARTVTPVDDAFNRCTICGVTEKTDRKMEFRYCAQCAGTLCYCINHIHNHPHKSAVISQ